MRASTQIASTVACLMAFNGAAFSATELINPRDPNVKPVTGSGPSFASSSSADGRFVAFSSYSRDFVPGDTNERADIFVYDRDSGTMERISVSSGGAQGNSDSTQPAISADGRYIAFASMASNLVANDTNNAYDVFVHDRQTHATTRVSVTSSGAQSSAGADLPDSTVPSISSDGRFVAFLSTATNLANGLPSAINRVFVRDTQAGTTSVVSISSSGALADQSSSGPMISGDGNSVAFASAATNLVANDTNTVSDIFVRNLSAGTTIRASVDSSGAQGNDMSVAPALSANGRFVVFQSIASNLVAGDANNFVDAFLRDLQSNTTLAVSAIENIEDDTGGETPSISADGNLIAYTGYWYQTFPATTQIFSFNRQTGERRRLTNGPSTNPNDFSGSGDPFVSGNGRYVFLTSDAYNFVTGDGNNAVDVFAYDLQTSKISLASVSKVLSRTPNGGGSTTHLALSNTGRYATFSSSAASLVEGDSNGWSDVFVTDRSTQTVSRVSVNSSGEQGNDLSRDATINGNGNLVAFTSWSTNFDPAGSFGQNVYVRNRSTGITTIESADPNGEAGWGESFHQTISANGRYVAFASFSSNLIPGAPFEQILQVYVRDRQTGVTSLISKSSSGVRGDDISNEPSISADGRYVVFSSYASNLVSGDTFGTEEMFIHDRQTGTTKRLAVGAGGEIANGISSGGIISASGRYAAFFSTATNLVSGGSTGGLFIRDLNRGVNILVTADGSAPSFSADGRFLAFSSSDDTLVPGDTNNVADVFVYDQLSGLFTRESLASDGSEGNDESILPSISLDGRVIAFTSAASNFVADDNNGTYDVFARTRQIPQVVRINVGGAGFTDSQNRFWEADRGYNTGSVSTYTSAIAGTHDDVLYQTERWDADTAPELQYSIAVPNGSYLAKLHFAENYTRNFAVGARVFDVDMEGVRAFENIDIFKEAGARTALVKSASTTVNDGKIDIVLRHQAQNPIIDAIEVIQQ